MSTQGYVLLPKRELCGVVVTPGWDAYKNMVRGSDTAPPQQPYRFVEYSISSTLMVWTILVLLGDQVLRGVLRGCSAGCSTGCSPSPQDVWLYLAVAAANFSTMMFGLLAERAPADMWIHVLGWIPFVCVWTIINTQFVNGLNHAGNVPAVVHAIPWVQFALFTMFGLVQLWSVAYPARYIQSEVMYTLLSLTAKTMLVWMLYGGVTSRDSASFVPTALC